MTNITKIRPTLNVVGFIFLLFIAQTLGTVHRILSTDFELLYTMTYIISIGIYISLFLSWTISVHDRIMQSHVRAYLMLIGVNIILWVSIRAVKWSALVFVAFGDRLAWYMYYIPMIMIPLLFFFTALYVGEDENYRPNKKWNLLFIPAVLLMLLVLTNDLHMLVFNNFDITIRQRGQDYGYGIGYFITIFFMISLMLLSIILIARKFSRSVSSRKASRLPLLVFAGIVLYAALYMIEPSYGIGYYFIDLTMFGCAATIAFWEACIQTGLVHSNHRHKDFFEMATTKAQILNNTGEAVYISENAISLSPDDFEKLKLYKNIDYDEETIISMSPINSGYVLWSSDVSSIKNMIAELENLNKKLYEEVDLMTLENEQKREATRVKKLNELHSVLISEALPYSEKIKANMMTNKNVSLEDMKYLLFETSMISTYLKRKVNLILTEQTEKCISTDEMHRAFLESFQLLRFHGKVCGINISDNYDMSLDISILCYDLYQKILEKSKYSFDSIFINYKLKDNNIVFSIDIDENIKLDISEFENFEKQKLSLIGGELKVFLEEESYHFSLSIAK